MILDLINILRENKAMLD